MAEGRVHGMTVWQSIKQALPFAPKQVFPGQSGMPASKDKRFDVETKSTATALATRDTPFSSSSKRSLVETESTKTISNY
jgi:hypothetical protein